MTFTLVILESPYKDGDREANAAYARRCMADCLAQGEAPFASHLLYTQVLTDEDDPQQRRQGIEAGLAWGKVAAKTVVYIDRGISPGMQQGIARAHTEGRFVEYRTLSGSQVQQRLAHSLTAMDAIVARLGAPVAAPQQGEGGSNL
jgi:hypothetical protein